MLLHRNMILTIYTQNAVEIDYDTINLEQILSRNLFRLLQEFNHLQDGLNTLKFFSFKLGGYYVFEE